MKRFVEFVINLLGSGAALAVFAALILITFTSGIMPGNPVAVLGFIILATIAMFWIIWALSTYG